MFYFVPSRIAFFQSIMLCGSLRYSRKTGQGITIKNSGLFVVRNQDGGTLDEGQRAPIEAFPVQMIHGQYRHEDAVDVILPRPVWKGAPEDVEALPTSTSATKPPLKSTDSGRPALDPTLEHLIQHHSHPQPYLPYHNPATLPIRYSDPTQSRSRYPRP